MNNYFYNRNYVGSSSKEILEEDGVEVFKMLWFKLCEENLTADLAEKIASSCVLKGQPIWLSDEDVELSINFHSDS